jgi:hypothetical protein
VSAFIVIVKYGNISKIAVTILLRQIIKVLQVLLLKVIPQSLTVLELEIAFKITKLNFLILQFR